MKRLAELVKNAAKIFSDKNGKRTFKENCSSEKNVIVPEHLQWLFDAILGIAGIIVATLALPDDKTIIGWILVIVITVFLLCLIFRKSLAFRMIIIVGVLGCVLVPINGHDTSTQTGLDEQTDETGGIFAWEEITDAEPGETIYFGEYRQSMRTTEKQKISWIVLAKEENKLLILSEQCLDCQPFNASGDPCTWENSSIHDWLNKDFFEEAFNSQEQKIILNSFAPEYEESYTISVDTSDDTGDKVFLLSIIEVEKYFHSNEEVMAFPTEYTLSLGAGYDHDIKGGPCWWWLRTPGDNTGKAADIRSDGTVNYEGYPVASGNFSIRPALWLSIDA